MLEYFALKDYNNMLCWLKPQAGIFFFLFRTFLAVYKYYKFILHGHQIWIYNIYDLSYTVEM